MKQPFVHLQPVKTFEEIGGELGITRSRAHQLYCSAMTKLRKSVSLSGTHLESLIPQRRYAIPTKRKAGCM